MVLSPYWEKDQPPKRDKRLAEFCQRCLFHVIGELRKARIHATDVEMPTRGFAVKPRPCYAVRAEVTDLEYNEWRDLFDHYAAYVIELLDKLRAEKREADRALKLGLPMFCGKNGIELPPEARAAPSKRPPNLGDMLRFKMMQKAPGFSRKLPG